MTKITCKYIQVSLTTEMSELANRLKVLSTENRQNAFDAKEKNNLKIRDFPFAQASISIIPFGLENFAFEPNFTESEKLYHNLASWISELLDIRTNIAMIIAQIQDMEQPGKLFFENSAWKQK